MRSCSFSHLLLISLCKNVSQLCPLLGFGIFYISEKLLYLFHCLEVHISNNKGPSHTLLFYDIFVVEGICLLYYAPATKWEGA